MVRARGVAGCQENLSLVQGLRAGIVFLSELSGLAVVVGSQAGFQ